MSHVRKVGMKGKVLLVNEYLSNTYLCYQTHEINKKSTGSPRLVLTVLVTIYPAAVPQCCWSRQNVTWAQRSQMPLARHGTVKVEDSNIWSKTSGGSGSNILPHQGCGLLIAQETRKTKNHKRDHMSWVAANYDSQQCVSRAGPHHLCWDLHALSKYL